MGDSAMDIFGKEINHELKKKRKSPRSQRAGTVAGTVRFGGFANDHKANKSESPRKRKGKHPRHVSDECGMKVNMEALYTFRCGQRDSITNHTTKMFTNRSEPITIGQSNLSKFGEQKETKINTTSLKAGNLGIGIRKRGKTSWGDLDEDAHLHFE